MRSCSDQKTTTMNGAGNRADLSEKSFLKRRGLEGGWSIIKRFGECCTAHGFPPEIYARLFGSGAQYIFTFCNCGRVGMGSLKWGSPPYSSNSKCLSSGNETLLWVTEHSLPCLQLWLSDSQNRLCRYQIIPPSHFEGEGRVEIN